MCLRVSYKKKSDFFLHPLSHWKKESDLELDSDADPYLLVRDRDPHQMSRISNTVKNNCRPAKKAKILTFLSSFFPQEQTSHCGAVLHPVFHPAGVPVWRQYCWRPPRAHPWYRVGKNPVKKKKNQPSGFFLFFFLFFFGFLVFFLGFLGFFSFFSFFFIYLPRRESF